MIRASIEPVCRRALCLAAVLGGLSGWPGAVALADEEPWSFTAGARLQLSGWEGENRGSSETDFEAGGALLGLSASARKGRLYTGVTFTGGEFEFDEGSPDRVGESTSAPHEREATVERGEFDLLVGYWFWDRVSLFADVKSVHNEWPDEDYALRYGGLGVGVSGYYPLSERWTLYASFGIVPLNIRAEGKKIGEGRGAAFEFGALMRLSPRGTLTIGLKNQHQEYEFDNGDEQTHDLGGLAIGYNHRFGED